jgi:hypothetical protein
MTPLVPPFIRPELIFEIDAQLSELRCCAVHVVVGPALVGIGWDQTGPVKIEHPELDSYLHAELIAQRVNALVGSSDHERTQILANWEVRV